MQDTLADPESVFQLLHPLGRGSYGAVYKSRVIKTGELVAVKIIPLAADDEIESIQREIAMLRDCQHANIVKYYGSFKSPDSLWIVMEYCAGGSVSDIMHVKGSGLSEELIKYIVGETLAGLAYLHSVGKVRWRAGRRMSLPWRGEGSCSDWRCFCRSASIVRGHYHMAILCTKRIITCRHHSYKTTPLAGAS